MGMQISYRIHSEVSEGNHLSPGKKGYPANLKYKSGNRNFGAAGYYVSTVGLNAADTTYIREQEKQDQIGIISAKKDMQTLLRVASSHTTMA